MDKVQLHAVTATGALALPVPAHVDGFNNLYDDLSLGVYSALRTFEHNKFLWLDEHLARTRQSMALLGWQYELDELPLRQALHQVCTAYPLPEARVRFDVLAAPPYHLGTDSRVVIGLMPFTPPPAHYYTEGVAVALTRRLSRERPLAKTADFAQKRQAVPTGTADAYEQLMVNAAGYILEGVSSNFYAVRHGILYTAGHGVLEGVTRKIILQLAADLNLPVRLEAIHVDEIDTLDEAALSGSSRALLPVVKIDNQIVGNGRPGPICRQILHAYEAFVAREIKAAV